MTKKSRYSYTTSWAVGRRFRSDRRIAPMSRRCAGANLAISVRNSASADRRATADWVLPGTSTSTWTERRPEAAFFTLMIAPSRRECGSPVFYLFRRALAARGKVFRSEDLANLGLAVPAWPVLFVEFHEI